MQTVNQSALGVHRGQAHWLVTFFAKHDDRYDRRVFVRAATENDALATAQEKLISSWNQVRFESALCERLTNDDVIGYGLEEEEEFEVAS